MWRWKSLRMALKEKVLLGGLSYQEVADRSGASRAAIYRLIRNREVSLATVERLMKLFGLEIIEAEDDTSRKQGK